MLTLRFANRLETLADLLAAQVGRPGDSVFLQDEVVIPSAALRRLLTLHLARRYGICAGVRFSYLARWLWQQIAAVVPGVAAQSPFDADLLAWRIHAAFGDAAWVQQHARLAAYLGQADPAMRFELATTVAAVFAQYLTYRADWLATWAQGGAVALGAAADAGAREDERWQAALWRRLLDEIGLAERHPAARFVATLGASGAQLVEQGRLPPAVHVFALPDMPPMHLALLQALGTCVDVQVYALNPCREYWFDVVDRRRLAWLATRVGAPAATAHLETGHRLLAGWGRQTQARMSQLVGATGEAVLDDAHFVEPAGASLLARLQRSILDLAEPGPGTLPLAPGDRSIELHVCHSRTRELEVLHDRLLALFAQPEAPAPHEVLVVTPDLEATAPLVDAIFGTAPKERHIPYTVTGRARSRASPAARVLLELLALATSRFAASQVFGLLRQPLVARRFGLDEDDLERVHGWLGAAGVHWAFDAAHRGQLGLPATARHSFADGLERLFLGYALPTGTAEPFDGRLPAGDPEGADAQALGALWRFVDELGTLRARAAQAQRAADWVDLLGQALETFAAPKGDELDDLREVQGVLQALGERIDEAGVSQALPLEVLRSALAQALDDPARGGVPSGAVTFASIGSLRNLPFRVVCAIGLDDGVFPGGARPTEFDLMARAPREGDLQRRLDERNLFLDLLLAAREVLHLGHVGRSVRDNAVLPPSVLVSELLDLLVPAIADDPADPASLERARERLVVEHPLQPFAEAAFRIDGDPRLRSFDAGYAEALRARLATPARETADAAGSTPALPGEEASSTAAADIRNVQVAKGAPGAQGAAGAAHAPDGDSAGEPDDDPESGHTDATAASFFSRPLAAPGPEWDEVPIERLARFFRQPSRFLLEQRLGDELARAEHDLQDDEPFVADLPGRSALARRLLPALLAGADLSTVRALAQAGTEMPAGAFGRRGLEHELGTLQRFALDLRRRTVAPCLDPITAEIEIDAAGRRWRLHAGFADLRPEGLVRHRYDDLRPADRIDAWLQHLMLCAAAPAGVMPRTVWCARDGPMRLGPCAEPHRVLQTLLGLYARGLREPLPFFPKTAWAYVNAGSSVAAAARAWEPGPRNPWAEGGDAAVRLALRGRSDPLGTGLDAFHTCAHEVFDPLRECLEDASA
jgi:exodeoxyribonuclease V gamma subunit